MHGTSDQFLAGAGLTFHKNGAVAFSYAGKDIEDTQHLAVLTDDVVEGLLLLQFLSEMLYGAQIPKRLNPTNGLSGLVS